MVAEGMVNALRRAGSLLYPGGIIVDIHPTPEPAHLELATNSSFMRLADRLDDDTANGPRRRHAAADEAVAACVSAGTLTREAATEFTFHTLAETVDELLEYLNAKWKQLHFADADLSRARDDLARHPGSAIAVTERVTACRLRAPLASDAGH
jgi:hypothetical protein